MKQSQELKEIIGCEVINICLEDEILIIYFKKDGETLFQMFDAGVLGDVICDIKLVTKDIPENKLRGCK